MLGASGVGKTRFLNYLRNSTIVSHCPTVGVDFIVYRSKHAVALQIWDTSGSDRFKSVVNNFLKGVDLCIFVYNDKKSFEHMMNIIANVKKQRVWKTVLYTVVGQCTTGKERSGKVWVLFLSCKYRK